MTLKHWLTATAVVGVLGASLAWIWAINSEQYRVAQAAIRQSPEVASKVGGIQDITLRAFRFRKQISTLFLEVKGSRATLDVTVKLVDGPDWRVEEIALSP